MRQNTRKTWVSVIIAAVIIVGVLAVTAIGGTAYFIYRHVNAQFTPSANAQQRFVDARARFAGQKPLIEMRRGNEPLLHRDAIPDSRPQRIETLRVLAYDEDAGKLVNVSIPLWLLRLFPSKRMSFLSDNGIDFDSDRMHLSLEDLERRGPGLILDQADRRGSQVLVWTE
jgi:hypothetical protein